MMWLDATMLHQGKLSLSVERERVTWRKYKRSGTLYFEIQLLRMSTKHILGSLSLYTKIASFSFYYRNVQCWQNAIHPAICYNQDTCTAVASIYFHLGAENPKLLITSLVLYLQSCRWTKERYHVKIPSLAARLQFRDLRTAMAHYLNAQTHWH